jgi:hypothetical protein
MNETSFTLTERVAVVLGGAAGIGRAKFALTLPGVATANPGEFRHPQ